MTRLRICGFAILFTFVLSTAVRSAPELAPFPTPAGYKSVKTAKTVKDATAAPSAPVAAGYLGVVIAQKTGRTVIDAL